MLEYLSCKACTWSAPQSAGYRESHPEYQASSSKQNSRFPKSLPLGTDFCTTFHAEKEHLQECQKHSKPRQKMTPGSWKRTLLRSTARSPSLCQPLQDKHNSRQGMTPPSSQTTVFKTRTHTLSSPSSAFFFLLPYYYH